MEHKSHYKAVKFGRENIGVGRALRTQQRNEERKEMRNEQFSVRRGELDNCDNNFLTPEKQILPNHDHDEVYKRKIQERIEKLQKWKEEKNKKKILEKLHSKPAFKVGIVTHKVYSPITIKNTHETRERLCKNQEPQKKPRGKISQATIKRLARKANAVNQEKSQKPKKKIPSKKESLHLLPKDHEFKAPLGVEPIPLFGQISLKGPKYTAQDFSKVFDNDNLLQNAPKKTLESNASSLNISEMLNTANSFLHSTTETGVVVSNVDQNPTERNICNSNEDPNNSNSSNSSDRVESKSFNESTMNSSPAKTIKKISLNNTDLKKRHSRFSEINSSLKINSTKTADSINGYSHEDLNNSNSSNISDKVESISFNESTMHSSPAKTIKKMSLNNTDSKKRHSRFSEINSSPKINSTKTADIINGYSHEDLDNSNSSNISDKVESKSFNESTMHSSPAKTIKKMSLNNTDLNKRHSRFSSINSSPKINSTKPTENIDGYSLSENKENDTNNESKNMQNQVTEHVDEQMPVRCSPFIVMSRGKLNVRKEHQRRFSQKREEIPTKETVMQNLNTTVEEEERTAQYYNYLLDHEIERLTEYCDKWNKIKDEEISEEIQCIIQQPIGQTELLMNKKFKRFRVLVHDCETGKGEMLVTCKDLQGFWEMMYREIKDCEERFNKLEVLQSRNWVEEEEIVPIKKKVIKKPTKSNKTKKPAKVSSLRAHILALRQKKAENDVHNTSTNMKFVLSGDINIDEDSKVSQSNTPKSLQDKSSSRNSTPISARRSNTFVDYKKLSGYKKRVSSPLVMMKISNVCKNPTPDIELDSTIVYPNSDRTPAKGILKSFREQNNDTLKSMKSTNKVLFKDSPTEIREIQYYSPFSSPLKNTNTIESDDKINFSNNEESHEFIENVISPNSKNNEENIPNSPRSPVSIRNSISGINCNPVVLLTRLNLHDNDPSIRDDSNENMAVQKFERTTLSMKKRDKINTLATPRICISPVLTVNESLNPFSVTKEPNPRRLLVPVISLSPATPTQYLSNSFHGTLNSLPQKESERLSQSYRLRKSDIEYDFNTTFERELRNRKIVYTPQSKKKKDILKHQEASGELMNSSFSELKVKEPKRRNGKILSTPKLKIPPCTDNEPIEFSTPIQKTSKSKKTPKRQGKKLEQSYEYAAAVLTNGQNFSPVDLSNLSNQRLNRSELMINTSIQEVPKARRQRSTTILKKANKSMM